MNPYQDYGDSRREPLPGAWRTKQPSSGDYYGSVGDASAFRDPRYDYAASYDKKADYDAVEISTGPGYDRLNSNQPVFPPLEDRQVLAGGESRKRPIHDTGNTMYQSKMSRPHESRSSTGGPSFSSYRFAGDASEILQEESRKCIAEMSQELAVLDNSQLNEFQYLAHTRRLLNEEINKVTTNMNPDWLDVESSKASVKVLKRVLLPRTKPGSNVVGRLMGVGGQTLKKMCQTYKCHISICGSGSRKNAKEEQDLLRSGDSRYNHLACPLHAEVSTTGPPHLAYTRLGQILTLLHKIITIEERFEHDGLVFETSSDKPARRRDDGDEYESERYGRDDRDERRSFRGRGRGRGRGHYNGDSHRNRSEDSPSHYQQRESHGTSWRTDNDSGNEPAPDNEDAKPVNSGRGRGRGGGGGFVPRGRGAGFVPRARNE